MKRRILCVCNGGNCRSVALAEVLKGTFNCEAISASTYWLSRDTMHMLCKWADLVVPVEPFDAKLPQPDLDYWKDSVIWADEFKTKLKVFALGPDIWGHEKHAAMRDVIRTRISEIL